MEEKHDTRAGWKLVVGYVRVSTKEQGQVGKSLEAQRAAIETFAEEAGFTLIETYEDVASGRGAKSFHSREGLQHALDHAVRDAADVLVWSWDRLTRYSKFEKQVRKVLPDERRIICIREPKSLDAASRAARHRHSEHVAEVISRRTKEEMARRRKDGAVFGNPEIHSLQPLAVKAWSNTSETLIHEIADVLRQQNDPHNLTHAEVATLLNDRGLRTGHRKSWTASRVRAPRKKAMELLIAEHEEMRSRNPHYGTF